MLAIIQNQGFWNCLNDLIDILKPLHEAQKMSESNKSHLEHVVACWLNIEQHFRGVNNDFTNEIENFCKGLWRDCMNTQLLNLHWIVYFLTLMHYSKELKTADQLMIMHFFRVYLSESETSRIKREFFNFCSRIQEFDNSVTLKDAHNSLLYWCIMISLILTQYESSSINKIILRQILILLSLILLSVSSTL